MSAKLNERDAAVRHLLRAARRRGKKKSAAPEPARTSKRNRATCDAWAMVADLGTYLLVRWGWRGPGLGLRPCHRPARHPGPCSVEEGHGGGSLPAYPPTNDAIPN